MKLPTLQDILDLHTHSIERFGGESGVLNEEQLQSFLPQLQQAIFYQNKTKLDIAAWILCRLVQNHYFVDGNKRVGLGTALTFLKVNNCTWNLPDPDFFYTLTLEIAANEGDDILPLVEEKLSEVIIC